MATETKIETPEPRRLALTSEQQIYYWDKADEFFEDFFIRPASLRIPGIRMVKYQKDMLRAISHNDKVAIESGHGCTKSTTFMGAACWFMSTRMNTLGSLVKVPCIAPTLHQLMDVLWPEFKRWIPQSGVADLFQFNTEAVWIIGLKDSCYARARAVNNPDAVQGQHASHLLWICDECFGIRQNDIWETIEGSLTMTDNRIMMGGQHTVLIGYCHDAFHRDKEFWETLRLNSEKCEVAKPEYSQRIARKYGKNSDIYRVRVLGTEPKGNPDSFFQLEDIEAARNRDVPGSGALEVGCDPAGEGGDLGVVTIRWGNHIYPQEHLAKCNSDQLAELIINMVRKYRKITHVETEILIKILLTGGYGQGTYDILRKNKTDNIRLMGIHETTKGTDEFSDVISTMWGEFKEMLPYCQIEASEDSEFLVEELVTRSVGVDNKSRYKMQDKKTYKKNYDISPDRSDSLMACITRRTAPVLVWLEYNSNNPAQHRIFEIEWNKIDPNNVSIFIVLWAEKDLGIQGQCYFWGRKSKTLRVYSEVIQINPLAETLSQLITERAAVPLEGSAVAVSRLWGNEDMFTGKNDLAGQLRRLGVRLNRIKFDTLGSVSIINYMFSQNQIVLHTDCVESDRQWRDWKTENGKPDDDVPMCKCLCAVVNQLKEAGELFDPPELEPYSQRKYQVREKLRADDKPVIDRKKTGDEWLAL